jgi:hypothetical protein
MAVVVMADDDAKLAAGAPRFGGCGGRLALPPGDHCP